MAILSRTSTGSGLGTQTALRTVTQLRLDALTDFTFPYRFGGRFYLGKATVTRTATGSGLGTQTASGFKTKLRTATGAGTGTQTATGLKTKLRTATGSGLGTQTATSIKTPRRTATGSGAGTQTAVGARVATRTATSSGVGSQTASGFKSKSSIATGSGVGTQTATGLKTKLRTASGSGAGSQTATGRNIFFNRTATGSGVGTINVSRTNLVADPNIEGGLGTGWASAQSPLVASQDFAISGTWSLKATWSNTGDSNAMYRGVTFFNTGTHFASAYFYIPTGSTLAGRTISISLEGGTITATGVVSTPATLIAGSWVRVSYSANITALGATGFTNMVFRLSGTLSTAVGQIIYGDAFLLEQSSTLLPYFDGAGIAPYPGYTLTSVGWNGTANASTSTANFIGVTQLRTVSRTGVASAGTGSSTTSRVITKLRTASASGQGTATSITLHVVIRTSTGSGLGTSSGIAFITRFRAATGSATGTSSASGLRIKAAHATGSGTGSSTLSDWFKSHIFRMPTQTKVRYAHRLYEGTPDALFAHTPKGARAKNLYRLTDGSYVTTDPRKPELITRTYLGGHDNFLSDQEVTELTAAGYGSYIT
jgi:hypothetical protein